MHIISEGLLKGKAGKIQYIVSTNTENNFYPPRKSVLECALSKELLSSTALDCSFHLFIYFSSFCYDSTTSPALFLSSTGRVCSFSFLCFYKLAGCGLLWLWKERSKCWLNFPSLRAVPPSISECFSGLCIFTIYIAEYL